MELLRSVGIKAVNIEKDNVIKIRKRENFELFFSRIGFLPNIQVTRHSKFWIDKEKNKVLKIMIDSYKDPSKYISLPRFKQ